MSTKGAPMPKKEETIANNPMRLYSYLVCISGLASYPDNTRMFRQKNLMLTQIQSMIGITNDTIKLYLFKLEEANLIHYKGTYQFQIIVREDYDTAPAYRKACVAEAKRVWSLRYKNEKEGVYHIPRPNPYIPIPEQTLLSLNETFQCSELELKLYLLCCNYRDECEYRGIKYKAITFEKIRDTFGIKNSSSNADKTIRRALLFLKAINLIDFTEGKTINRKNASIPCFKLHGVQYYINYKIEDVKKEDIIDDEIYEELIRRIDIKQTFQKEN